MKTAICIIAILMMACVSMGAGLDDFVRGTWLTLIQADTSDFKCVAGLPGWVADSLDWENELSLLQFADFNLISAFLHFEREWMEEVCLESGGSIKMYIGHDTQYFLANRDDTSAWDSLNTGFWVSCDDFNEAYSVCYHQVWQSYPGQDWKDGYDDALEYWASYADSNENAVFGYGLAHELNQSGDSEATRAKKYSLINYMGERVHTVDGSDRITSIIEGFGWPINRSFLDSVQSLDIYEYDKYPYNWGNPIKISGVPFQIVIDDLLNYYDSLYSYFTDHTPWVADIQTFLSWERDGDYQSCKCDSGENGWEWTIFEDSVHTWYRMPSREEIRLQTFLAISRGSKGAMCFVYGPAMNTTDRVFVGLIDYNDGDEPQRRIWNPNNDLYYSGLAFNYPSQLITPYDHVKELFAELEQIGQLLVKLMPTAVASYGVADTLKWVDGTASDWLVKLTDPVYGDSALHYWEATTFIDTSTVDSTDYFMLVNRVTCPDSVDNDTSKWVVADARQVRTIFTRPPNYLPVLEEIYTQEIWHIDAYDSVSGGKWWFSFDDYVEPGDGDIYRVIDSQILSGPITDSVNVSNDVVLTADLVIDTGGVLVIEPGVNVFVYPDFDDDNQGQSDSTIEIITKGKIIANGTSFERIRFIPFADSPDYGDWVGIYLDEDAIGEFSYCDIQYGERGLELRPGATAAASNCNISYHIDMGIYNYKGYLDLSNSTISYNGSYGLYAYMAADSVDNTVFTDNEVYGIKVYGTKTSNDSTFILNDTLSCIPSSTQYGIYLENNNYVRVHGCKVSGYNQGGIYLKNSDAIVDTSDFSSNNQFGLYAENGASPFVRYCQFYSLHTGVKAATGSRPDLGDSASSSWGNSSFDSSLTHYVNFSNSLYAGAETLWAQYNWWGTTNPSSIKFVTDSRYKVIMWNPYRNSQPKIESLFALPNEFCLSQNYPNPFNPTTTIAFVLDRPGNTVVSIYNLLGQQVKTLISEYLSPGQYQIIWDGRNNSGVPVSSGVYFYTLQSGDRFDSKKMLLIR